MKITDPSAESEAKNPAHIPDHELLRQIGRGAYGEVWLARNLLGTLRAVKIIYRSAFEHRRPYEREFEGIQRYEPISRTHPSQVAILHVGRHECDEFYYYVMELADDCGEGGCYVPKTLQTELKKQGRLPLTACLDVALSLATALNHLHRCGLIHRDIKLPNVIFVQGVPKLADIGLVAEKDSTVSFVGTRGYFPPEGPGTAQADIYSLGKVLYEISTGKDRNEFPDLPADGTTLSDDLLEFNEIIIRACHSDSRQRYRAVEELLADLSLLRKGRSVRQKHLRERWFAVARKAALIAISTAAIAFSGFLLAQKRVTAGSPDPVPLRLGNEEFWRGMHAPRRFDFSRASDSWRFLVLTEQGISLWDRDTGAARSLRLALPVNWQVHRLRGLPRWSPDGRQFVFQGFTRAESTNHWALFLSDPDSGTCEMFGGESATNLPVHDLCWLPDGSAVTGLYQDGRLFTMKRNGEREFWAPSTLAKDWGQLLGGYSPDGKWLLTCLRSDSEIESNGEGRNIWILPHLGRGAVVPLIQQEGLDAYPTWSPDGESVVFSSAGGQRLENTWALWRVRLDRTTLLPLGAPEKIFTKSGQKLMHPAFVGNGQHLVYGVEERDTRISVADASAPNEPSEVMRGRHPLLSRAGNLLYFVGETAAQKGIFALDLLEPSKPRTITSLAPAQCESVWPVYSLSADGTELAFFSFDQRYAAQAGIFIASTSERKRPRLFADINGVQGVVPHWSTDGQWLAYAAGPDLFRLSRDGTVQERLAKIHRWEGWTLRWSPDGRYVAALGYETDDDKIGAYAIEVATKRVIPLTPPSERNYKEGLEWHPDGQRLTYFYYAGPDQRGAQIRRAYIDGRQTELMIDQDDHWDYVGVWSPDGNSFHFTSGDCAGNGKTLHVYHAATGNITHAVRSGGLPRWSVDGKRVTWTETKTFRSFELWENALLE